MLIVVSKIRKLYYNKKFDFAGSRTEDREGEVCRRRLHDDRRGLHRVRRSSHSGRNLSPPRTELLENV